MSKCLVCGKELEIFRTFDDKLSTQCEDHGTVQEQVDDLQKERRALIEYLKTSKGFGTVDSEYTCGLVNGIELALSFLEKRAARILSFPKSVECDACTRD